ncbi:MAG: hypothetical protein IGS03_11680 [Candidatus Sericytochromatia bacterium]|nr:hypothetical protein [Candidatus Sericytochromatia bacterium]
MANFSVSRAAAPATPPKPQASPPAKPRADLPAPLPLPPTVAQDNIRVVMPQLPQGLSQSSFSFVADAPAEQPEDKTTPGDVLKKHGAAVALEQVVHKGAHRVMHRAATTATTKAATTAGARAAEHAVGHAAGEALAHGAGHAVGTGAKILSRAVPAVGAGVAGYLAYKSGDAAIEAGKKGNVGAALSYGTAAVVDGAIAGVNAFGAATGVGNVISVPVSLGLAVVATGFASLGAWLDE